MTKKFVIVGGVAGGASAAARIRRLDEKAEIQIYEKGPDISFSNCALPNYFSGEVGEVEDLVLYDPQGFMESYNLPAKTKHEVVRILHEDHKVVVRNLLTGEEFEDSYDYLILSPGARAIVPPSIKGHDGANVFTIKNVEDVRKASYFIEGQGVEEIVVVGGGFIGVEMAENLTKAGKKVSLVEFSDQIMAPFDYDMVQMLHKEMYDNGVNLVLNEAVSEIYDDRVVLASGKEIESQAVILAIGVRPDVDFAVESGIELGETGGILVDEHFRSNLQDVYAVGDAIETFNFLTGKKTRLALAGPAQREARIAVNHIFGRKDASKGVIGSSCIRLFDLNAGVTGLTEKECLKNGIDYEVALVIPNDRVKLMPGSKPVHFKLIFEKPTGRILGAQAIGKGDPIKKVDIIAAMITMGADLEDLKELELCYAPSFSTAKDVVNYAALVGLNLLEGEFKQVSFTKVRDLVKENAFILDVRGAEDYDQAHVKGAVNIPMNELRKRYDELPRDRTIYIHCRTAWTSYYSLRALKGLGFEDIVNIQGSFLQLSYYEYFNDMTSDRERILTGYNFE